MAHEYIALISYGKDSLKMLDVIHFHTLPKGTAINVLGEI